MPRKLNKDECELNAKEHAESLLRAILQGLEEQAQRTGCLSASQSELVLRIYAELSKHAVDETTIDAEFADSDSEELRLAAKTTIRSL